MLSASSCRAGRASSMSTYRLCPRRARRRRTRPAGRELSKMIEPSCWFPSWLLFVRGAFFVGLFRCFVSLYGVIESTLAVFHSLGMITFTMVLGSGAMCLGRIVMMLGGFKVCIFWHIHS